MKRGNASTIPAMYLLGWSILVSVVRKQSELRTVCLSKEPSYQSSRMLYEFLSKGFSISFNSSTPGEPYLLQTILS